MNNPSIEKMKKIAVALLAKTQTSEVNWEETETEGTFQVAFSGYSIRLSYNPNRGMGMNQYFLAIHNEKGIKIEESGDVDIDGDFFTRKCNTLQDLYEKARRQSMGVDKALDDILMDLE